MMRPIENLQFDQRFRQCVWEPFTRRINVFAEIGMMNETFAADFQFRSELAQIGFQHLTVWMHKGIEAENEIDRRIGNHRQRAAIVEGAAYMRIRRETLSTRVDAFT